MEGNAMWGMNPAIFCKRSGLAALLLLLSLASPGAATLTPWQASLLDRPFPVTVPTDFALGVLRQDHCDLQRGKSAVNTPLTLGTEVFEHGLGAHATSRIRVYSPEPLQIFSAWIGVDHNPRATGGSVVFSVRTGEQELFRSKLLRYGAPPERIELRLDGATQFELLVSDGGDGPGCDHADWADAMVITEEGKLKMLDEMPLENMPPSSRFPFSFTYAAAASEAFLLTWPSEKKSRELDANRSETTITWTDPETSLQVIWTAIAYHDFPAMDWTLHFENAGQQDSAIIENVQVADLDFARPMPGNIPYRLQKLRGGVPHPTLFEPTTVNLLDGLREVIGSETGRTSSKNAPFFRIETGQGVYAFALEWSGTWEGIFANSEGALKSQVGMQKTHFLLHPGERVRQPRVVVLNAATVNETHALFRQLVYKHYASRRGGKAPEPVLFCNTCFTRGGAWLNECNAENQISLIEAYAPLGLEALLTDAGWFTGGWPDGAGNWDPRKDAYPDGMAPVAAAAKENDMIYGLWFEPERVMRGSTLYETHPEWLIIPDDPQNQTCLANFGLKEVQDYFFEIVAGFMELPGFRVYRQDFNMDPLAYWQKADPPDRQGITEIRYVEGLYAYWERIREAWPDSLMEECASGGHRVELGTVMRMDIHQIADYWFDDEANQASLWAIGQYLPNNVVDTHINRMDDYSFHSVLAASLCLGWIADDPEFDAARAKELTDRYLELRHLLVGAWYPLTPYPYDYSGQQTTEEEMWGWSYAKFSTGDMGIPYPNYHEHLHNSWVASQYHRPDLDEGMLLVFRRKHSPYGALDVKLNGLEPQATYELTSDRTGETFQRTGAELMERLLIELPEPRTSDLIVYRKSQREST